MWRPAMAPSTRTSVFGSLGFHRPLVPMLTSEWCPAQAVLQVVDVDEPVHTTGRCAAAEMTRE